MACGRGEAGLAADRCMRHIGDVLAQMGPRPGPRLPLRSPEGAAAVCSAMAASPPHEPAQHDLYTGRSGRHSSPHTPSSR